MNSKAVEEAYELVCGLEIHVQLNTHTKIFCADSTSFGAEANTHVSVNSLALPGALPKLNKEVIEKAVRIGLALNCEINRDNYFDRKNYFYADLPKGYQITQDNAPICLAGYIDIDTGQNEKKRIRINRIHLEEDAGKSMHDQDPDFSYIDLNRAGTPLIEIVTEPDIRSAEEAAEFFTQVRKLVRHLNVSDGNMEEGSLRCDANISIRPKGDEKYGARCEVKNLNSIKNVARAVKHEFGRQCALTAQHLPIQQSTLNFDAELGTTSPMRSKELANDYRYFPDPDLLPVHISAEWLEAIKAGMPPLPEVLMQQLIEQDGLALKDAALIAEEADLYRYYKQAKDFVKNKKSLANWLLGAFRAYLKDMDLLIGDINISPKAFAQIVDLADDKRLAPQLALQELIPSLMDKPTEAVLLRAESLQLLVEDNEDLLHTFIDKVLLKFPKEVENYKKGKKGLLGLFVGEVMKEAKGKADAKKINEFLTSKLK